MDLAGIGSMRTGSAFRFSSAASIRQDDLYVKVRRVVLLFLTWTARVPLRWNCKRVKQSSRRSAPRQVRGIIEVDLAGVGSRAKGENDAGRGEVV